MAGRRQIMVEPPVRTEGLGSCDTAVLRAIYPASPVYSGELTDDSATAQYTDVVLSGEINDGGHTFGTVKIDYQDAPDLNEVEIGGGGKPGTPYSPNVAVNPDEPHNPAGIPAAGADPEITSKQRGGGGAFQTPPGTGSELAANPKNTSAVVSTLRIGSLRLGRGSSVG